MNRYLWTCLLEVPQSLPELKFPKLITLIMVENPGMLPADAEVIKRSTASSWDSWSLYVTLRCHNASMTARRYVAICMFSHEQLAWAVANDVPTLLDNVGKGESPYPWIVAIFLDILGKQSCLDTTFFPKDNKCWDTKVPSPYPCVLSRR